MAQSDADSLERYRRLYGQATAQISTLQREITKLRDELRKHEPAPATPKKADPGASLPGIGADGKKMLHVGPGFQYDPPRSARPDKNKHQENKVGGPHWISMKDEYHKGDYADEQPAKPRIPNRFKRKRQEGR